MLTRVLRTLRLGLRGTVISRMLRGVGLTRLGKRLYNRRILARGFHNVRLVDTPLRFAVSTEREIARLDSFAGEETFVRRMLDALGPGDTFYDVGGNIGLVTTVVAARHRETGIQVFAFEPEPTNAKHLRRNVELNGLKNVLVRELALGDATGTKMLFLDGETGSGAHSLMRNHSGANRTVEIRIDTASDFARKSGAPPDVVKIDVEGAEMSVLKGMCELLAAGRVRELFIEVHPETLARCNQNPDDLRNLLEQHKYCLVWSQPCCRQIHQHYRRKRGTSGG